MPLRLIVAYVLIGLVLASLVAAYLQVSREQRALARCERAYRRAQKRRKRLPRPQATVSFRDALDELLAVALLVSLFGVHLVSFFVEVFSNLNEELLHYVIGALCPVAAFFCARPESVGFISHSATIPEGSVAFLTFRPRFAALTFLRRECHTYGERRAFGFEAKTFPTERMR